MSMGAVSIGEVARKAGVSRATVSRVLNQDTAILVASVTRERVNRVAVEMGYHPNAVARGLAGKPMNTVGVVMAYDLPSVTSDPYVGPVLDGILETNKRQRQKTLLFTENDWVSALRNVRTYCDGHADGLLLIAPRADSEIVGALKRTGRPFVLVGDSRNDPETSTVDVDNVGMAETLTAHLVAQGRCRIAMLCGNDDFTSNAQRMAGYRLALERADLPILPEIIRPGEYWEWSGFENARILLDMPAGERPDAIFCGNGRVAKGALKALESRGMAGDIALAACCESPADGLGPPQISAGYMPLRQIGQAAVETLLGIVRCTSEPGRRRLFPAESFALA